MGGWVALRSLSWAHSSISCQLQFGVSQLSAGLGWPPSEGQLGSLALGNTFLTLASGLAMLSPWWERKRGSQGQGFESALGLLLISSCPKWIRMSPEAWIWKWGRRQSTDLGRVLHSDDAKYLDDWAGQKYVFCSQSTVFWACSCPQSQPTFPPPPTLQQCAKPWCSTIWKTCLW